MTLSPSDAKFQWSERVDTDPRWVPSPAHCRVDRYLVSYTTELGRFVEHLQAAAEGLERPAFTDYDDGDDECRPGVTGYRIRTADEHTRAEREAIHQRETDLLQLAALAERYPGAARDIVAGFPTP